jgi:WD40 repeat protein
VGTLSGHERAVISLAAIDKGRTLVSLGYEGTIKFWDTASWLVERSYALERKGARYMAFSPDERTLALSVEGQVQLRSVEDGAVQAELPLSTKAVYDSAFSPDGRWLAAGAADGKIRVWTL